ncbi:hypothetical protein [Ruminococcus sp.]|uniref:hypothetical protein n=1 Tax=Ruminococcus sp. TaxID=41978 RepID=UPI00386617F0
MNAIPMEVSDDRKVTIVIDGEEYDLVFTTRASKAVAAQFGDLEHFGDKILNTEDYGTVVDQNLWLITLLANQGIMIHNLRNREHPKPLLSEEEVELLTSPAELSSFREKIFEAIQKGSKRNIKSEAESSKNAEVG